MIWVILLPKKATEEICRGAQHFHGFECLIVSNVLTEKEVSFLQNKLCQTNSCVFAYVSGDNSCKLYCWCHAQNIQNPFPPQAQFELHNVDIPTYCHRIGWGTIYVNKWLSTCTSWSVYLRTMLCWNLWLHAKQRRITPKIILLTECHFVIKPRWGWSIASATRGHLSLVCAEIDM